MGGGVGRAIRGLAHVVDERGDQRHRDDAKPTPSQLVPIGPGWVYEIKHDGYRLMVRKAG